MRYRKAIVVGIGVGLLLAIAAATIDDIIVARLFSTAFVCPDPRCTQAARIGRAEPLRVLIAFLVGFGAAFAWFLRRQRRLVV